MRPPGNPHKMVNVADFFSQYAERREFEYPPSPYPIRVSKRKRDSALRPYQFNGDTIFHKNLKLPEYSSKNNSQTQFPLQIEKFILAGLLWWWC